MPSFRPSRPVIAAVLTAALCASASAQLFGSFGFGANVFETKGLDSDKIPSQSCTGFYKTPSFKCESIKVPVHFARAKGDDRKALVVVAPGAGGLDKRHSDYAKFLAENGINAVVMDPWRARGMTANSGGLAELATANRKVQAMKRQPGQHLLRRMIDTQDGARDWQHYVFPATPGKGVAPVKVSARKILVPTGMPEAERQQLLARAAAMRVASASPASPPVLATRKGDTNAQKTHVSLTEMKAAYEVEGKSLDDLCKRYRMGKSRVLKLLREAGTEMRPSGRKSKPVKP